MTRRAILVVLFFAALTSAAHAAEPFAKIGSIYTLMSNPRGVRNIGMGLTGAADVGGATTGHFNPASLAWVEGATLGWSREAWAPNHFLEFRDFHATAGYCWKYGGGARAVRIGGAINYATQTSRPQPSRTIFLAPGTGTIFRVDDDYGAMQGAVAWEDRYFAVGVGLAVKYLRQRFFVDEGGRAWSHDIGVVAAFPFAWRDCTFRPRLGASSSNRGNGITSNSVPAAGIDGEDLWGVGLDMATKPISRGRGIWQREVATFAFRTQYDRGTDWAVGGEVSLFGLLDARYGWSPLLGTTDGPEGRSYGFGLGWEVDRWMARLDYARTINKTFPADRKDDIYGATIGGRW